MESSRLDLNKLCYLLLYPYIFLSIFEFYINANIGFISRYFMLFFTVLLILRFFICGNCRATSWVQFLLGIWLVYYLLSMLWSTNLSQARVYVFTVSTMTVVFLCAFDIFLDRNKMSNLLLFYQICSVALCVLGVFFSAPLSLDGTNDIRYVLYIGGVRTDPNYLLSLYAISVQIGLYNFLNKKGSNVFNLFAVFVGCYVILMTGSRSGIVILIITVVILGIRRFLDISFGQKIGFVLAFLIVSSIAYYVFVRVIPEATLDRVIGTGSLSFTDGTGRLEIWAEALKKWTGLYNIICGMGFGSNTTHNTILTFLMECGILGFALFLIPNVYLIISLTKNKNTLAIVLYISGMIQAFLCPASNMRFFWNAMIIPALMLNAYDSENQESEIDTFDDDQAIDERKLL